MAVIRCALSPLCWSEESKRICGIFVLLVFLVSLGDIGGYNSATILSMNRSICSLATDAFLMAMVGFGFYYSGYLGTAIG